jgi:hypothetical protein
MKRIGVSLFSAVILGMCSMAPAGAETSEELEMMWACPQADGITLYTNNERTGCHAITLKPLLVSPDLATIRKSPRTMTDTLPHRDRMPSQQVPSKDTTSPYQTE